MRVSRLILLIALVLTLAGPGRASVSGRLADLPSRLTDQEFWQLSEAFAEPNGSFQSDNLLSNEVDFQSIVPELVAKTKPGGVYLGVGPEQNFTYIAAMKPRMAFITDIRRGNLHEQLMYKALFELSADRAEFVSRLFTRPRPAGLSASSSAADIMNAYWDVFASDEAAFAANLRAVDDRLTKVHHLALSAEDLDGIAKVYRAFYWYGPVMTYSANITLSAPATARGTNYRDLMDQTGEDGEGLSYLGSEEKFRFVKDLEAKNLIVPIVGNFVGPKALRAIGGYIMEHGATVTAFYVSNVESYLHRDGSWPAFCSNVATMPLTDTSVFIRPSAIRTVINGQTLRMYTDGTVTATANPGKFRLIPSPAAKAVGIPAGPIGSGLVPMMQEVRDCGK